MSKTFKLLIPTLDTNLTKDYLTPEYGFVDVFNSDLNKPQLDHHFFFMFTYTAKNQKEIDRLVKMAEHKSYIVYDHVIKGEHYMIYAVPESSACYYMKRGSSPCLESDLIKIIRFWNCEDEDVNHYIFNPGLRCCKHEEHIIPEADYVEIKKPLGLTIEA